MNKILLIFVYVFFSGVLMADNTVLNPIVHHKPPKSSSDIFSKTDKEVLKKNFLNNILSTGAVIASPSQSNPSYYFDWVRDSAITMNLIHRWYQKTKDNALKERLFTYVNWVDKAQHQIDGIAGQDILGEPKFYLDGRPYDEDWGRPQNDGPALRATVLIRFANTLIQENNLVYVQQKLYGPGQDPLSMGAIKLDLNYLMAHWEDENFDLWEEVYGHHFFTALLQRHALIAGAKLARYFHEEKEANNYLEKAALIEQRIAKHFNDQLSIIQETFSPHPGPQKTKELDSAVLLAILYQEEEDDFIPITHPYLKNSLLELKQLFKSEYPINDQHDKAILFGRYPNDSYDGYRTNSVGNPWIILTASVAEYYYRLANNLNREQGLVDKKLILSYIDEGDDYLKLIKQYAPSLKLSEQINLNTGEQQGAHSLTWSFVAVFRALEAREKCLNIHGSK